MEDILNSIIKFFTVTLGNLNWGFLSEQFGNLDLRLLLEQLVYDEKSPLIFSSGLFMCMFAVFIVIYTMLKKKSLARTLFVVAFSYYFYYKSSGFYFFLIAIVTCSDYVIADLMAHMRSRAGRKCMVALSLIIDLGLLGYFKYTNFFGQLWSDLSGAPWHNLEIFLPVGISFFTFQSLSYTIDVYRRKIQPVDNLLDYAFYVSFFPQLVAGPIVRASDFIPQMYRPIKVTREMLGLGFWFVITGLFKKAVISDYISVNFVERVFDTPMQFSGLENLLGAYGYGLQIYCDFSGYSDMAIGLALLMGFRFNINFNNPYKAVSITDFWHRWHISLSTWLRDYLYISLGGNRKGRLRQYLNLFVTMLLGGLWHGASLNFVMWGALHGIALVVHKMWMGITAGAKWVNSRWWRALMVLVTFHFVIFAWLLFRNADVTCKGLFLAGDWGNLGVMLTQIFTNFHPELFVDVLTSYWHVFSLIALGYVLHFVPDRFSQRCKRAFVRMPVIVYALVLIVVIVAIIQVKTSEIQPFIYFQF
ncbi:MAG: MBOAT family protein [Muribaculaceae bacterium]|nr:MBOAT family protein [Muribaculaceae bacterium]